MFASGPMGHASDMTIFSRNGSIGGLVTYSRICTKRIKVNSTKKFQTFSLLRDLTKTLALPNKRLVAVMVNVKIVYFKKIYSKHKKHYKNSNTFLFSIS